MQLKGRLGAIVEKIPACGTMVDVGTDHAYIPISAVKKGICTNALAIDVRTGPVKIAERNVRRYKLEDKIEVRLGCGLEPVQLKESEVAVIAGMGGPLICEIIHTSIEKARDMRLLILQPMNAVEVVRKWLDDEGFSINEEILACEGDKIYNIICTRWTDSPGCCDNYENYIGKELLGSTDPLLGEYLGRKLRLLESIIMGREKSNIDRDNELESLIKIRDRLVIDMQQKRNAGGTL